MIATRSVTYYSHSHTKRRQDDRKNQGEDRVIKHGSLSH